MRKSAVVTLLTCCTLLAHSQAKENDQTLLKKARAANDAPFARNLQSFDCAVDFDWKQHWVDTLRVGDEGTDDEIERLIQPIRNHVTVTSQDAIVSSGMTEEREHALPRGGMAEGLLKHAVRFSLRTWLVASNNALLPSTGTPVHFESSPADYKLEFKIKSVDAVMMLASNMSLSSIRLKGSDADHQELEFHPGSQGLLLASWTMGENGNFKPGNRLIFTYTYQTVDGFQIPAHMIVNRESHHEVWKYTLSGCKVIVK